MNASKMQTSKLSFHRRNSLIFRGGGGFVYKQKSRPKGEESALVTGNPAVPVAASSDLPIVGGIAVSTFGFPSPFQAPTNNERPSAMLRAWTPGLLRPRHRFWPRRLALLLRSPRLFQHRIRNFSLKCQH